MAKYQKKIACGSKLVIVTDRDEFEIEAVAPSSSIPPPLPPDFGISFAASELRYIGLTMAGSDTNLTELIRQAPLGARVEALEGRTDAWILFEAEEETADG